MRKIINIDALIERDQNEKAGNKMIRDHKKKSAKVKLVEVRMNDSKNTVFLIHPSKDPEQVRARFYETKRYTNLPTDLLK